MKKLTNLQEKNGHIVITDYPTICTSCGNKTYAGSCAECGAELGVELGQLKIELIENKKTIDIRDFLNRRNDIKIVDFSIALQDCCDKVFVNSDTYQLIEAALAAGKIKYMGFEVSKTNKSIYKKISVKN